MNYLCHRRRCRRFRWRWPTILDVAFFFHLETKFRLDGVRFISEYNQFEIDLTWVVLCIVLCYIRETWIFWSFWSFGDLVCDITNWTVDNVRLLLFFRSSSIFPVFACVGLALVVSASMFLFLFSANVTNNWMHCIIALHSIRNVLCAVCCVLFRQPHQCDILCYAIVVFGCCVLRGLACAQINFMNEFHSLHVIFVHI